MKATAQVHFLGLRSDVLALLPAADWLWVPSRVPAGLNATLEAMSAGRVVLASRLPDLAELVLDGTTGVLIPPGDKVAWARNSLRAAGRQPPLPAAGGGGPPARAHALRGGRDCPPRGRALRRGAQTLARIACGILSIPLSSLNAAPNWRAAGCTSFSPHAGCLQSVQAKITRQQSRRDCSAERKDMERTILPKHLFAAIRHEKPQIQVSQIVVESAAMDAAGVYARFATRPEGLTAEEAAARLAEHGPNVLAKDQRAGIGKLLWHAVLNPLVILLAVLASISFATGDARAGIVMSLMIALGVGLKLIQEAKADSAAAKLKAMISVTATVDPRRQAAGNRRLATGSRRRGEAGGGGHDPRRRAHRRGEGSVRDPGLAHGRELPGREVRGRKERGDDCAHRTDQHRVPGHQRRKRLGDGGRRRHREGDVSGRHGRVALGAADADGLRQGHRPVHLADAAIHSGDGAPGLRHQWPDQGQLGRSLLLRRRRGRRPDARDAADDRDGLPLQGRAGDEPQEGDRQADQRHSEPGGDGRALHRQDRHADDGPRHPGEALRRGAEGRRRRARAGVHEQPLPDRPEERPGPRGARAYRDPRARRRFPNTPRWTKSPSTFSAASCRSSSARPKARTASSAREPRRRSFRAARTSNSTASSIPMDHCSHRGAQGGVRAALGRWLSRAGHRQQGRRAARRRRGGRHALLQGRRVRPDPERLCRLPRSAEGDRHGGDQGPARPRRRGQGRHRRQRPGRPQDLQRSRAVHRVRAARQRCREA